MRTRTSLFLLTILLLLLVLAPALQAGGEAQLAQKILDGGWMVRFQDGTTSSGHSAIAIPSGYIVATASSHVRALRWSFSADASDLNRVKFSLTGMIESFPELRARDQNYIPLAQFLGCDV